MAKDKSEKQDWQQVPGYTEIYYTGAEPDLDREGGRLSEVLNNKKRWKKGFESKR